MGVRGSKTKPQLQTPRSLLTGAGANWRNLIPQAVLSVTWAHHGGESTEIYSGPSQMKKKNQTRFTCGGGSGDDLRE